MKDFQMRISKRTTAELCQELAEDRQREADIEHALREQMFAGHITVQEALQRLWDRLVIDASGDGTRGAATPDASGEEVA
jgi:hypothetical protein